MRGFPASRELSSLDAVQSSSPFQKTKFLLTVRAHMRVFTVFFCGQSPATAFSMLLLSYDSPPGANAVLLITHHFYTSVGVLTYAVSSEFGAPACGRNTRRTRPQKQAGGPGGQKKPAAAYFPPVWSIIGVRVLDFRVRNGNG